ncbi:hypothetical protein [Halostella pelagica]|uniref:hypothetical protein n=1 Tax=Halostella pelagica TaxID=2583824 RepID=UPI001080DFC2|nr:hypothetical protein [Halostella pelagica]
MKDNQNRDRGVLTPADRAFLRGETTLRSEQSAYDARYRIRRRLRNAICDLALLFEHAEPRDREGVFADDALDEALVDALAFFYLGLGDGDRSRKATFLESIYRAERKQADGQCTVSATFDVERTDAPVDEVIEKIERGAYNELSEDELRAFAHYCGERENVDPSDLE